MVCRVACARMTLTHITHFLRCRIPFVCQQFLHRNCFSGMTDLAQFYIDGNYFFGNLPSSIGAMANLKSLSCFDNVFSGTLSSAIGKLKDLVTLYLDGNHFTGSLLWAAQSCGRPPIASQPLDRFHSCRAGRYCRVKDSAFGPKQRDW